MFTAAWAFFNGLLGGNVCDLLAAGSLEKADALVMPDGEPFAVACEGEHARVKARGDFVLVAVGHADDLHAARDGRSDPAPVIGERDILPLGVVDREAAH